MMLGEAPTVLHEPSRRWLSISTRVMAPVPSRSVQDAHFVVGEADAVPRLGYMGASALRSAASRALTGPLPSAAVCKSCVADPDLHDGLGVGVARARRLPTSDLVVEDLEQRRVARASCAGASSATDASALSYERPRASASLMSLQGFGVGSGVHGHAELFGLREHRWRAPTARSRARAWRCRRAPARRAGS